MAGISLNLIAGSNGIMERATKAADTYDYAKLEESLELSNAEMLLDCLGGGDLETDLYDYIVKRCNENADKTAQTSNGKYWLDSDGRLCYTDSDTNGTVKLRKDSNGNPKIIDPNAPITTYRVQYDANGGTGVPTDTSEYEEGDTVNVNFGTTPTRERYVFLGWATNASAIVPDYTSGANFTMGTQNVTLYAVWTGVSGTGTTIMKGAWYGDTVNYSANGMEDWKVFLNDGENIYLIASDYVLNSGIPDSAGLSKSDSYNVSASNQNQLVNAMLETENWKGYVDSTYAISATGGPTVTQVMNSCNEKYGTTYTDDMAWNGICLVDGGDELYGISSLDKSNMFWLATMITGYYDHVYLLDYNTHFGAARTYYTSAGIRPLVKLSKNVKMTWNGSSWDLSI